MDWLVVTSPDNFERTRGLGFVVQGFKAHHRSKVARMRPGDRLAYYLIREGRFAASAVVRSCGFEECTRIWVSPGRPEELYPCRVKMEAELVLPPDVRPRAGELVPELEFVKKWPGAHWRLAFQGMLREIPDSDGALIRAALWRGWVDAKGQEGHPG